MVSNLIKSSILPPVAWICTGAAPLSRPAPTPLELTIVQFAHAQRSVDQAEEELRDAVASNPQVVATRQAFAEIKREVMRWRTSKNGGDLNEMSHQYMTAKRAVAAAEAAAAPDQRRRLSEEEARLDVLRKHQERVAHDSQTGKSPAAAQGPSL